PPPPPAGGGPPPPPPTGAVAANRDMAERAFDYLTRHFWDEAEGGVYWMPDHRGQPMQGKKQVYAQAFVLYAFAEFYLLTRRPEALGKARALFWLIEFYSRDKVRGGYFEAFSRHWQPLADLRLSEKDDNEAKTMNTHLHALEAYTTPHRTAPDDLTRVAERAARSWSFIENHLLHRERGEWFWGLKADRAHDKAGPWEYPYHNGRGCMEIMRRIG
ncbi:MAG: AGE family epimerase/isomerase, partial [Saprospiraceae bacterium]